MQKQNLRITGPFRQLLTLDHLPLKGGLKDAGMEVIGEAGIVHQEGKILEIGNYHDLCTHYSQSRAEIEFLDQELIALPGMVDPHTHLCWAGSRERDYAMRLEGISYVDIAQMGGGIWDTVTKTRNATDEELRSLLTSRALRQLRSGITTCEVKSGYDLDLTGELRLLEIIRSVDREIPIDLISTCLAAHIKPHDFDGSSHEYLQILTDRLLPEVKKERLASRIDIFVEEGAFGVAEATEYLMAARQLGFERVVHGEQFTSGGVGLAIQAGAASVDHLEMILPETIQLLAKSEVVATALPGASLGLGCRFAPARQLLDAGCCLAIGSDWNPGSAPMGDLLVQTAILGTFEKLSMTEQLAAVTYRAAHALNLHDRGKLANGYLADFIAFPGRNYKEILYQQGMLKPSRVWKRGMQIVPLF